MASAFYRIGLLHPTHDQKPKMRHNLSGKFECVFSTIDIQPNNTVLFQGLSGSRLGSGLHMEKGDLNFLKTKLIIKLSVTTPMIGIPQTPMVRLWNRHTEQ